MFGDGNPFPYVLTINGDTVLDDTQEYTAVICGYTDDIKGKGNMQDTGIIGMDAMRSYLTELGSVSKSDI